MKQLFKTNISALQRVRFKLQSQQTMSGKQVILGYGNSDKVRRANELIGEAEKLLESITTNNKV